MTFVSFIFLSIEDIAVQIEEPFAILPLDLHQQWLERDADQMLRLQEWANERRKKKPGEVAWSPENDAAEFPEY